MSEVPFFEKSNYRPGHSYFSFVDRVATSWDLARLCHIENILKHEKRKARNYLSLVDVMVVAITSDQTVRIVNSKACEALGYKELEIVGKNWFDNFVPQEDRSKVRTIFQNLIAGNIELAEHFENSILTKTGEKRTIVWHNNVLRDEGGAIIATVSSGTDVTDSRCADKKINTLNKKLASLEHKNAIEAIVAFVKTIEAKDAYTGRHGEMTVHYAVRIANAFNLSPKEKAAVKQAAILHDLGKIGVSESILYKRSSLAPEEFNEIKKHPQAAVDILKPMHFMRDILPFILHHHERWDGKGYPSGLKGEAIPFGARIVSIAGVYQALTSDRPYRRALPKKEAIRIIKEGSGAQFDPRVTDIFLKIV